MSAEFNHRQWRLAVLSMPGLTDGQKVDILTRGEHCHFGTGTNSYISQAKIAKINGHDRLQALRSDRAAVQANLLEVEKQRPGATTIYRLTRPPVTEGSQVPVTEESRGCDPSITGGVTERSHEHSSSFKEDQGSKSQAKSKIDFVLREEEAPSAQAAARPVARQDRKATRSAPPGGGTTQARAPSSKASREDREAKDDEWDAKNSFWVDSDGKYTRLADQPDAMPGEIKIELDAKVAQHEFWAIKQQKRRQMYMRAKFRAAKSAPSRSTSAAAAEEDDLPHTDYDDADPALQAIWDRVLKLYEDAYVRLNEAQVKETNAAFVAKLGFGPGGLSYWSIEQFGAAEDYLTDLIAARRAA